MIKNKRGVFMKLLKTSDELISHMKIKGIKFDIVKEEEAKIFLQNNNYYMKLASYRANYDKRKSNGEYINLDFAYLRELSTIDMHLRYLILLIVSVSYKLLPPFQFTVQKTLENIAFPRVSVILL